VPEPSLAVLVDFENMARPGAKSRGDFDIQLVLSRLAEKGRVLVKRAYADWSRYRDARHDLQNAGLELIELPSAREGAKNRADIKLAVDAMELAYSREHLDYFVIVSGDSDFTPLVGKVRELNKRVIGIAHKDSASDLLIANCDEFIYYETIAAKAGGGTSGRVTRDVDPVDLVRETLEALQREGVEWPLASVVKDSMRRKFPAFDESDHGHSTFSKFLEAMRDHGIVRLETDPRSGTYRVELTESRAPAGRKAAAPAEERPAVTENGEGGRRRRRRRRGAGEGAVEAAAPEAAGAVAGIEEGMEVFEIRVTPTPDEGVGVLPPLDQPISYEDMLMLSPEVAAELPPVPETEVGAPEGPPPREARRRRRRGLREEEPAIEELEAVSEEGPEARVTEEAAPGVGEAPAVTSRRRVRRRGVSEILGAPGEAGPEAPAEAAPATEEEAKPKRRTRRKAAEAAPGGGEAPVAEVAAAAPGGGEAPAAEEEAKPKRRVRKKAAEAAPGGDEAPVAEVAVAAPGGGEAPAAEEEAKPKRRVRKKAAPAGEEAAAAQSESIGPSKSPY
jgi:uncharacterized protein (TIGR00288 family)